MAFFDLPWMPVYLAICFLFHTFIGVTALFGAVVLVTLTIVTEIKTRHPTRSAAQFAVARNALLEASRRNADAITAMGMVGRIAKHWHELNRNFVASSGRASDVGGGLGATSKVLRLLLQSAILAVGAWLVINQQSTPGIIIVGSILGARALAPVDLAIAYWRGFVTARQSWQRLSRLLAHLPPKSDPMPLKPPSRSLLVQNGAVGPPGVQKVVCQDVNFTLAEGELRCLIGPNGAGKSTFFEMLTGQLEPSHGEVLFRGNDISRAHAHQIARLGIGIKTQVPSVFDGLSVRENIHLAASRLNSGERARRLVDDMLERIGLTHAADRVVGQLAHGQRQWVELGLVLSTDPQLILLDEPAAGMTHEEVHKTAELVREINRTKALIVVEHDMQFIRMIAKQVTVFNRGSVLVEDAVENILRNPLVRDIYLGKQAAA